MYLIKLEFNSNETGIYTKEEETATNDFYLYTKYERMLVRWINILCPYMNMDCFNKIYCQKIFQRCIVETLKNKCKIYYTFIQHQIELNNELKGEQIKFKISFEGTPENNDKNKEPCVVYIPHQGTHNTY